MIHPQSIWVFVNDNITRMRPKWNFSFPLLKVLIKNPLLHKLMLKKSKKNTFLTQ